MTHATKREVVYRGLTLLIWALLSCFWITAADAQRDTKNVLAIDVPVLPDTQRYIDLLQYPGILVIALENIGIQPTNSGRLAVRDRRTLEFKNSVLHYKSRDGALFRFEGKLTLSLGLAETEFRLPIEVDTAAIEHGHVVARIFLTLAEVVPVELTSRISTKIQSLATQQMQERLIAYLDDVTKKQPIEKTGVDAMFETILIDHYNRALAVGPQGIREPGDAEPLADQVFLLLTLLIWLVIVPIVFGALYLRRRYKKHRA
jgi:hypothetical protein